MPEVGLKPTFQVFERANVFRASDITATLMGSKIAETLNSA
jgi:hypothetical protein